jgi:CRP/FNR family cyclic AMP-dependent transcriptional regulator
MTTSGGQQSGTPPDHFTESKIFPGSFLDLLTAGQRIALLELGSIRVYSPSHILMREGNPGDIVVVILRGLAKVVVVSEGGKEVLLGFRGRGDLIGEMAVLSSRARSATVLAATELQGCVIRAAAFVSYLERSPQVANRVSDIMADKLRAANRRRLEFNAYPAEGRVARVLAEVTLRYGHREGPAWRIGPEITQADLASLASASVRTIEKVLRTLEGAGLVVRRRRDLIVTDVDALEDRYRSLLAIRPGRDC